MLSLWPFRPETKSFALNGNHEMYGGGHGLAQVLGRFGQEHTYFALQNDHFTIIALDTASKNGALYGRQAAWVQNTIAAAGSRKVILLSHHQPFSTFEGGYRDLVQALRKTLEDGSILAWYWGHEHRCVLYEDHPAWGHMKGRLIGHGGYPYYRVDPRSNWQQEAHTSGSLWYRFPATDKSPVGGIVLGDGNPFVKDDHGGSLEMKYGAHGYAMLDLDAGSARETLHRPTGEPVYNNVLYPPPPR